jgi:hypothetical protein
VQVHARAALRLPGEAGGGERAEHERHQQRADAAHEAVAPAQKGQVRRGGGEELALQRLQLRRVLAGQRLGGGVVAIPVQIIAVAVRALPQPRLAVELRAQQQPAAVAGVREPAPHRRPVREQRRMREARHRAHVLPVRALRGAVGRRLRRAVALGCRRGRGRQLRGPAAQAQPAQVPFLAALAPNAPKQGQQPQVRRLAAPAQLRVVDTFRDDEARADERIDQPPAVRVRAQHAEVAGTGCGPVRGAAVDGDKRAAELRQRGAGGGVERRPDLLGAVDDGAGDAALRPHLGTGERQLAARAGRGQRALVGALQQRLHRRCPGAEPAGLRLDVLDEAAALAGAVAVELDAGDPRRDLDHLADAHRRRRRQRQPLLRGGPGRVQQRLRQTGKLTQRVAAQRHHHPDGRVGREPAQRREQRRRAVGIGVEGRLQRVHDDGEPQGVLAAAALRELLHRARELARRERRLAGEQPRQAVGTEAEAGERRAQHVGCAEPGGERAERGGAVLHRVHQHAAHAGDVLEQKRPGQPRHQPGAQERGLAAAARSAHDDEAGLPGWALLQAPEQAADLLLAAGEHALVADVEGAVGAERAALPLAAAGTGGTALGADAAVQQLAQLRFHQLAECRIAVEVPECAPEGVVFVEEIGAEEVIEPTPVLHRLARAGAIGDVHQLRRRLAIDQHLRRAGARRGLDGVDELPLGAGHAPVGFLRQRRAEPGPEDHQHDLAVLGLGQAGLEGAIGGERLFLPQHRLELEIGQILPAQALDDVLDGGALVLHVGGRGDEHADARVAGALLHAGADLRGPIMG